MVTVNVNAPGLVHHGNGSVIYMSSRLYNAVMVHTSPRAVNAFKKV